MTVGGAFVYASGMWKPGKEAALTIFINIWTTVAHYNGVAVYQV